MGHHGTISALTDDQTHLSGIPLVRPDDAAHQNGSPAPIPFERHAAVVLGALQRSLVTLLSATPGEMSRAKDVERTFGLDARLGWQIHKIATAANPLACGTSVPARVSMQRFLKAAARKQAPAAAVSSVSDAFDELEKMVLEYAGDRERFESMVSSLQREESEETDLKHKKAAYRALSHLWGVDVQTATQSILMHPAAQEGMTDVARLYSHIEMHRLRASAPLFLPLPNCRITEEHPPDGAPYKDLAEHPLPGMGGSLLLHDFSSSDLSGVRVYGEGTSAAMMEVDEGVGKSRSVTLTTGSMSRRPTASAMANNPRYVCTRRVRLPIRTMISDVLFHKDVLPIRHPLPISVRVYGNENIDIGTNSPEYLERVSLLPVKEHCEHLGLGVDLLGTPDAPRHVEMLKQACASMKWNPDEFHVYRSRVEYPMLRTTVWMEFDLAAK